MSFSVMPAFDSICAGLVRIVQESTVTKVVHYPPSVLLQHPKLGFLTVTSVQLPPEIAQAGGYVANGLEILAEGNKALIEIPTQQALKGVAIFEGFKTGGNHKIITTSLEVNGIKTCITEPATPVGLPNLTALQAEVVAKAREANAHFDFYV